MGVPNWVRMITFSLYLTIDPIPIGTNLGIEHGERSWGLYHITFKGGHSHRKYVPYLPIPFIPLTLEVRFLYSVDGFLEFSGITRDIGFCSGE